METKNRILEQASEMFFRQGIRSITMDEIADSLGMSKRTLYESFSNKEELLKECIAWQYVQGMKMRDEIERESDDDPLEIIIKHFRHVMVTLSSMNPGFFYDLQKYYSRLWKEHVKSKEQDAIDYTRMIIEKGIEKGTFRKDANGEILSTLLHSAIPLMISGNLFPPTRYSQSEVFRQVMINFIRGLATPDGLKMIDSKLSDQQPNTVY